MQWGSKTERGGNNWYKGKSTLAKQIVTKNFIPEGDLYRLITHSQLLCKKFRVEVLPSIRKHGIYETKDVMDYMLDDQDYREPWFVAKDVCEVLELAEVSNAIKRLDDDEKLTRTLFVSGQNRGVYLINESGLYSLILTSRKPEAKVFKKWVTSEVPPSIRKHGIYARRSRLW